MRYLSLLTILLASLLALWSCAKEPTMTFDDVEQRSLKAWMEKYHPELVDNYQMDGGYYVDLIDEGILDSVAISGKDVWVWFDFTARSLEGLVQETRNADLAEQLTTYTSHTHYVPALRFSGADSHTMMEGTYLATFNKLNIRDKESGEMKEVEVRYGTKLRLYLPSSVLDSNMDSDDGGYEGEFVSDGSKPMIVDMTILGHIGNPVAYEGERVKSFAEANGGMCEEHKAVIEEEADKEDDSATQSVRRRSTRTEEEGEESIDTRPLEFFDGRWHQPADTLEHLLVNYSYSPARTTINFRGALGSDTLKYKGENEYNAGRVYGNGQLDDVDRRINEALVKRFGEGIGTSDEDILKADSVHTKPTVKVWYIGRFLDGFVFDTNIDEVKEIVFGKVESKGEVLTFSTADPLNNSYILAWNYSIPTLRLGQWAEILTVSTYGYGIEGKTGSTTTTTTSSNSYYDYANYYNYMNYMNNYYGYGYGSMYNSGYYGYNPYYYGYSMPTTGTGTTTTTTTISTEIPAYAPLLFQVFVEKK